jgi:hypothetical protein
MSRWEADNGGGPAAVRARAEDTPGRCLGVKKDGMRCSNKGLEGTRFCGVHKSQVKATPTVDRLNESDSTDDVPVTPLKAASATITIRSVRCFSGKVGGFTFLSLSLSLSLKAQSLISLTACLRWTLPR